VAKPLALVRFGDGQVPATCANAAAALKNLFSFAQELGYLRFNVGKVLKAPPVKNTLAERILDEAAVHRMLALEPSARNRALLTLLYGAGLRISEVTSLRWRDLALRDGAGQVTVYGKGGTLVHGYANSLIILRFAKLTESPKVLKILPSGRIRATRSRLHNEPRANPWPWRWELWSLLKPIRPRYGRHLDFGLHLWRKPLWAHIQPSRRGYRQPRDAPSDPKCLQPRARENALPNCSGSYQAQDARMSSRHSELGGRRDWLRERGYLPKGAA
jgi:hypothetical protein